MAARKTRRKVKTLPARKLSAKAAKSVKGGGTVAPQADGSVSSYKLVRAWPSKLSTP